MFASLKTSTLVYVGTENGYRLRTEFRIRCVRLDKVTAIADMLQHEREDLSLPRNTLESLEYVFLICEIERIAHGGE
jgi:hypothetical protein